MSGQLRLALIALFSVSLPLFAVTIDGTVTLQGETDYSGTRVLFTEASPSAATDSAFTDESGFFSLDLAIGVYDIDFAHDGFVGVQRESIGFTANETLDPIELLASASTLFGELSGTISTGVYMVIDDITVPSGSTLTIEAGTTLLFDGFYRFTVHGTLLANGTETDSILFTRSVPDDEYNWQGIWFQNCADDCRIQYCIVEYSGFGGTKCLDGSPDILNCMFRYNTTWGGGGGLESYSGSAPYIANCVFTENTASSCGGLFIRTGRNDTTFVVNCLITNNTAESAAGGIQCGEEPIPLTGRVIVEGCVISGNSCGWGSGGLYLSGSTVSVIGCEISDNTASLLFAGVGCGEGSPVLTNCTITGNLPNGVLMDESMASINSSIIAFNGGYRITFNQSPDAEVLFSNFWQNSLGSIGNPGGAPVLLGQIVTVNQNSDSSDVYYNISQDPLFVSVAEGNFNLLETSRCIDAGDTTMTDPDGTINDMGAYYFPQPESLDPVASIPQAHALLSNYPNPFNPSTNISFIVQQAGPVNITVYDILSRTVAELVNATMSAGTYTAYWDAKSSTGVALPSGSYWVRLNTPTQKAMHRIVLIR